MRALRNNGLAVFFAVIFVASLVGQAFTGQDDFNHLQVAHQEDPVSIGRHITSSDFWVDVLENWQSEYLQFTLFILTTVWLVQKGSPESKALDDVGTESDEEQTVGEHATERSPKWARVGGLRTRIYSNSLLLVMEGDLDRVVARPVGDGPHRLQRRAARSPRGGGELGALPDDLRFLEPHPAELAVGVSSGRFDGRAGHLPPPARLP
jgi:hypothetical protein